MCLYKSFNFRAREIEMSSIIKVGASQRELTRKAAEEAAQKRMERKIEQENLTTVSI